MTQDEIDQLAVDVFKIAGREWHPQKGLSPFMLERDMQTWAYDTLRLIGAKLKKTIDKQPEDKP